MNGSFVAKPIDNRDRLIFALDVPTADDASRLIRELGDSVSFYKLGLQLFLSGDYFRLVEQLTGAGKKVFADLKLFDIPATVAAAVTQLERHPISLTTVHGNDAMLKAAAAAAEQIKILAVTALTSLDRGDLDDLGFRCNAEELVLSRARRALELGCAGVVSSGLEVPRLRAHIDHKLLVVCPGIRPVDNSDDQRRTVDVAAAFAHGADHIVVGRPIRDAADPRRAAEAIQQTIADNVG